MMTKNKAMMKKKAMMTSKKKATVKAVAETTVLKFARLECLGLPMQLV